MAAVPGEGAQSRGKLCSTRKDCGDKFRGDKTSLRQMFSDLSCGKSWSVSS